MKEELFRTLHESSFQFLCKFQERASEIIIIFLESEITTELHTCLSHSLTTHKIEYFYGKNLFFCRMLKV